MLPSTKKQLDNEAESEREHILPQNEKKSRPLTSTETRRIASNVLYFALQTLSSISNNVPVAGALSGIIEPLLDITSCIEQSSVNAQGLIQLATRIERLTPIIEEMAKSDLDRGQAIILGLQAELASMATALKAASQRGELNQFFNSADDASALSKYNMVLAQMIADSMVHLQFSAMEVLKSLRDLETSKLKEAEIFSPPAMGVEEFCREFSLDDNIQQLLTAQGFRIARPFCEVSDSSLREAGFRMGQIGKLRRALKLASEHIMT
ncbi:hypothetical protein K438DRAFT_1787195 [Mycena galopus ATCC 62051]|nr:hypothetical protein K438DRAFT_1787195 [Mycena galopus ATCC 62051]